MIASRRTRLGVAAALIAAGLALLGEQLWLTAKAAFAAVLIDRALVAHLKDAGHHRPWSWADLYPIARLEVPRLGVRRAVLSGASGSSLAFGPGHVDGTAWPGSPGNVVIAGHRDSWFAFLADLEVGDEIMVTTPGRTVRYRAVETTVVHASDVAVLDSTAADTLTLITCYPFHGLRSARLRYVVRALAAQPAAGKASALVVNALPAAYTTEIGAPLRGLRPA
ncbi:MAG: class GN sortase [Candidatus Schekmanbacteria bacterium]|nr:class GN sortase [Candidatus Schekmanbacteria bacterium]